MKRKFFCFVSLCLSFLMMLSFVPMASAETEMQAQEVSVTEPNCCDETVFVKGLLLNAILEEQASIDLTVFSLTGEEAEMLLLDVVNENENSIKRLADYSISADENGLFIYFEYAEPTVSFFATRANNTEIEKEKQRILSCVDESMSDMEKALVVHDYMVLNYEYDETYSIYSADGMFEHKTGVCQAYAEAFKEIMTELGIPCQLASSRAMNHAWNLVKIDGSWYHVDVTWDDPVPDRLGRVRHVFFLLSDDAISDPAYYRRPHYDWVASNAATNDRFDYSFWYDVDSAIVAAEGNWYYIKPDDYNYDSSGYIVKKNIATEAETNLYEIDTVWNVWDEPYSYWIGCFSSLGLYEGRLYFNTPQEIKSITLSGRSPKTVYEPNTSTGYIFGFVLNGTTITYGLSKSPNDGIESTGKCTVSGTAVIPVTGVSLNQTSVTLLKDETTRLIATVRPSNASNKKVLWTSSNKKVATVDENGVVTAKSAGMANIRVTTEDGDATALCKVTVMRKMDVAIEGESAVSLGKTINLTGYAYYEENGRIVKTSDAIEWSSSDVSVATVSGGKVTGVGIGTATITARIAGTDIYEEFEVSVAAPVTSLKFASTKMTAYVGNRFSLFYELNIAPSEHTDTIEWTSSDETVARVNQYGVVTPIATGTAKITAKAVAGNKTATVTVTVAREPEGIVIEGATAVAQGKSITLKAYAYYEENGKVVKTKDTISWMSSDHFVATVSNGKVTGKNAGIAIITAYLAGTDIEATFEVNVAVPVKTLKFASTKATVYVGHELDLSETLTVSPFDNTDDIIWTSSKESVAVVDENGVVTPIATGSAKITAKAVAGGKTASVTVTVAREPEGIVITGDSAVAQGKSITLKAYAYYMENGKEVKTKDVISWMSSDESVATVSKGKVTGKGAGIATIRAYIDGTEIAASFDVNVAVPVKTLKFASTKATVYEDGVIDLSETLTIAPFDNTDDILWTSSNTSVATVDANGVVTAISKGTAKITANAVAGKKKATVTVTVARMPEGIDVTGNNALAVGKYVTLKAYAYYEENGKVVKTKDVIRWESSDESVATVTDKGKVTAKGDGVAYIRAYIAGTGVEEIFEMHVVVPAKTVKLSSTKLSASVGDVLDLTNLLTVTPEEHTDVIIWASSKTSVATVTEDGVVTIVGTGTAKITVKAVGGNKSASVTVTVK